MPPGEPGWRSLRRQVPPAGAAEAAAPAAALPEAGGVVATAAPLAAQERVPAVGPWGAVRSYVIAFHRPNCRLCWEEGKPPKGGACPRCQAEVADGPLPYHADPGEKRLRDPARAKEEADPAEKRPRKPGEAAMVPAKAEEPGRAPAAPAPAGEPEAGVGQIGAPPEAGPAAGVADAPMLSHRAVHQILAETEADRRRAAAAPGSGGEAAAAEDAPVVPQGPDVEKELPLDGFALEVLGRIRMTPYKEDYRTQRKLRILAKRIAQWRSVEAAEGLTAQILGPIRGAALMAWLHDYLRYERLAAAPQYRESAAGTEGTTPT